MSAALFGRPSATRRALHYWSAVYISNVKHHAWFMVAYDAGLRVAEIVHLRIEDIDSKRMVIRVRQGKGRRDRYVNLSEGLLQDGLSRVGNSRQCTVLGEREG